MLRLTGVPTLLTGLAASAALAALAACAQPVPGDATITLATWNAQWLMTPDTFDELARVCIGRGGRANGSQRTIPCNLVPDGRWTGADLDRLRDFAAGLPADVFALQEVDGPAVAGRLFPGWSSCFTARANVQNVGFVIRPGIPHRCNDDYRALGLPEDDVRWGADLTLYPGSGRELRLLAVHLKSGCNRDLLTSDTDACRMLQRQVPVLEAWIDARAAEGARFAVLGDFNRRFDRESAPAGSSPCCPRSTTPTPPVRIWLTRRPGYPTKPVASRIPCARRSTTSCSDRFSPRLPCPVRTGCGRTRAARGRAGPTTASAP